MQGLGVTELSADALAAAFMARTAREWEAWAAEQDVPLAVVHDPLAQPPVACD